MEKQTYKLCVANSDANAQRGLWGKYSISMSLTSLLSVLFELGTVS